MSALWYYVKGGERSGPITEDELKALAEHGELNPSALIWQSGMGDWKPFSEIFPGTTLSSSSPAPTPMPDVVTDEPAPSVRRESRCANCKDECGPQDLSMRNGRSLCPKCMKAYNITEPEGKNGKAVAGFCLGALSVVCCPTCGVFSVLGIVFSAIGLTDYNKRPEIGGKGLAIVGIIMSICGLIKDIVIFVFGAIGNIADSGGM